MFENVNKICIIGGPGTGKSTLANNLGKELDLPVCHIDSINYFENWVQRNKNERDEIILKKINEEKWVMDGTYVGTLDTRCKNSDFIIFLNYSSIARVKGILQRYWKGKGVEKPDIPGCKEQMDWKFLKFTINWRKKKIKVQKALETNKNKEILVFKNRRQLNRWYKEKFKKKIEV